jgi:hypothetical protein
MSQKKTIKINTEFFKIPNEKKTKKKRDPKITPLIQPNSIKKELLNRIKMHKNKTPSSSVKKEIDSFEDEFLDSIQYLDSLSKAKQKEKESFQTNTMIPSTHVMIPSTHVMIPSINTMIPSTNTMIPSTNTMIPSINTMIPSTNTMIDLELPESLKEQSFPQETIMNHPLSIQFLEPTIQSIEPLHSVLEEIKVEDVPYGCLKGGNKPTYRNWKNTTQKNTTNVTNMTITTPSLEMTEREKKLEALKDRSRREKERENLEIQLNEEPLLSKKPENELKELLEEPKKFIKKTKKTTYTLGKSKTLRNVGVLIKDRQTRKKILNAQKDLKKEAIHDVKKYLRKHGLMKTGSNAPNDVLRKIYESSMLTGEIMNENKDILLHNLVNDS